MPSTKEERSAAHALKTKRSIVEAVEASGQVIKGFQVWTDLAPAVKADPDIMFAKCVALTGSTKDVLRCRQIDPPDPNDTEFDVPQKNAWNMNSQIDPLNYGDIGMLPHTNVPCVLDFLRYRFLNNMIYTMADPLVVAINPFKDLGNTTLDWIKKYRDCPDVTKLPPHVFYTSRTALENLHGVHKNQTIIVSGESGAGKTEATKQMMRYFAAAKSGLTDTRIQTAVMAANPVLEAFGNAKTIRNNNSSRFGRFMQLEVGKDGGIQHGSVIAFLLEKSRVLTQEDTERSYHVFYQFLKGADAQAKQKYHLRNVNEYKFINSKCLDVPNIDDVADYHEVCESFRSMKLKDSEIESIWSFVSGVLLLGNSAAESKESQGVPDAASYEGEALSLLEEACELLFLPKDRVLHELTIKTTFAGGQKIESRWKRDESEMLKASLAKAVYEKTFLWIIKTLNQNIQPAKGFAYFMGMLDIFGFEVFKNNSLEQFFINVTNEMLQKNFVDIVFERETKLYKEEGIPSKELVFTSNAEVITALTGKKSSVMAILEDQCLAPGGTDEKFTGMVLSSMKGNTKIVPAKVGGSINFIVVHTIGEIQYSSENFVYKNKDVLRVELMELIQQSENAVARALFEGIVMERGKLAKGQLIGSQFLIQLESLMSLINSTEPHFVRCVKPNDTKQPLDWMSSKILIQLHALSILEALQLRQLGYSYRRPFSEFLYQFKFINIGITGDPNLSGEQACKMILEETKIPTKEWAIGKTRVFLKQDAAKKLTKIQRQCLSAWEPISEIVEAVYLKKRYKKQMKVILPKAVRIQAHIRRKLVDSHDVVVSG